MWLVNATPRLLYPRERPGTQLYRTLGGPHGRSERVRKNLAFTGILSPDRPAPSEFRQRTIIYIIKQKMNVARSLSDDIKTKQLQ